MPRPGVRRPHLRFARAEYCLARPAAQFASLVMKPLDPTNHVRRGATLTPVTSENDARSALEREIYWAEDASVRSRMDTSEVRDLLHDFAMLMRADEKQAVPRGEPELGSGSRMRRKTKVLQFRLLRPMRRRNDRLLAEFGELAAALADRVVALETEVRDLQAKLGDAE
jgi:hypothetical protein